MNPLNTPGFTNICVDVDVDANVDADVVAVVLLDESTV